MNRPIRLVRATLPIASIACLAAGSAPRADPPVHRPPDESARTLIELLIVIGPIQRPIDPIADGEIVPRLDGTVILRGEEVDDDGSSLAWEVQAPAALVNDELARRAAASRQRSGAPAMSAKNSGAIVAMAASQLQFINFTMTATNNSTGTQYFGASDKLPTSTSGATVYGGTVVGTMSDTSSIPDGVTFMTPYDSSYKLWVDNVLVFTMLDDPYGSSAGAGATGLIGPANFGSPIPSVPGPTVGSVVELELQCFLTAGDTATLIGTACFW